MVDLPRKEYIFVFSFLCSLERMSFLGLYHAGFTMWKRNYDCSEARIIMRMYSINYSKLF